MPLVLRPRRTAGLFSLQPQVRPTSALSSLSLPKLSPPLEREMPTCLPRFFFSLSFSHNPAHSLIWSLFKTSVPAYPCQKWVGNDGEPSFCCSILPWLVCRATWRPRVLPFFCCATCGAHMRVHDCVHTWCSLPLPFLCVTFVSRSLCVCCPSASFPSTARQMWKPCKKYNLRHCLQHRSACSMLVTWFSPASKSSISRRLAVVCKARRCGDGGQTEPVQSNPRVNRSSLPPSSCNPVFPHSDSTLSFSSLSRVCAGCFDKMNELSNMDCPNCRKCVISRR